MNNEANFVCSAVDSEFSKINPLSDQPAFKTVIWVPTEKFESPQKKKRYSLNNVNSDTLDLKKQSFHHSVTALLTSGRKSQKNDCIQGLHVPLDVEEKFSQQKVRNQQATKKISM